MESLIKGKVTFGLIGLKLLSSKHYFTSKHCLSSWFKSEMAVRKHFKSSAWLACQQSQETIFLQPTDQLLNYPVFDH